MRKRPIYEIILVLILIPCACSGPKPYIRYIMESGRDIGFDPSKYVRQMSTRHENVHIITDSLVVGQRVSERGFLDRIPPDAGRKGLRTMGAIDATAAGFFYFHSDSLDTVTYVVVFDNLEKRIVVGLIEISPSSDRFGKVSVGQLYAHFNKSALDDTKHTVLVTYDVYGFLGDSLIVVSKLYL